MIVNGGNGPSTPTDQLARGKQHRRDHVMGVAGLVELAATNFAGVEEAAKPVRHYVRDALTDHLPDTFDAELLVTELFTNAILHSRSRLPGGLVRVAVHIDTDRRVARIVVSDAGSLNGRRPVLRTEFDETGRGLGIVESLSRAWGVDPETAATVVWCELDLPGAGG